jgi:aminoglycoside 2'-N-acetyltransferase I
VPVPRIRQREEFTAEELRELTRWLEVAYGDPEDSWRAEHWDDLGPGPHLVIEGSDGELLAHAFIAWVPVWVDGTALRAGYLEDVATRHDARGRGFGTALVQAARPLIEAQADLGLLSTGSTGFYDRLGWVVWKGPTSVLEADGSTTLTPSEDGTIMALLLPGTPAHISTDMPITRPRRDEEEAW